MKTIMTTGSALIALVLLPSPASSHEQHAHESYSAGEPGNPKKPSRTIEVEMSEMAYTPSRIKVKHGEQIRFVIRNAGKEEHEFLLATTQENLKHAEARKRTRIWSTTIPTACGSRRRSRRKFSGSSLTPARSNIPA